MVIAHHIDSNQSKLLTCEYTYRKDHATVTFRIFSPKIVIDTIQTSHLSDLSRYRIDTMCGPLYCLGGATDRTKRCLGYKSERFFDFSV